LIQASSENRVSLPNIMKVIKGERNFAGGYKWVKI
jgi:hypothetical protein